jgi:hypothetical protein
MSGHPVKCECCNDEETECEEHCHLCNKIICDDCVAATNEEHDLAFCFDCQNELSGKTGELEFKSA